MVKDIVSNIRGLILIATAISTEGNTVGNSVDTADFGEGLALMAYAPTGWSGSSVLTAEESDDNATFTPVAADKYIGSAVVTQSTEGDPMVKVGLFSTKRYIRPVMVTTFGIGETGGDMQVIAIQCGEYQPV